MQNKSTHVFVILVISQFCGTSLWFAGNAILPELQLLYEWKTNALGYLTSSVQLGFIAGTLLVSLMGITDRFSPSKVFFYSSLLAGSANLIVLINIESFSAVLASRFITGVFLAGIYPVGMKIAADWSAKGLGLLLGALVGALVLGTAFPQLLNASVVQLNPIAIILTVSSLAILGGVLVLFLIPDGPYRKPSLQFKLKDVTRIYAQQKVLNSAMGYFGHMWELYALWAFIPWLIKSYCLANGENLNQSLLTFLVISSGFIGCVVGGMISKKTGSQKVAIAALIISGFCCLLSPLLFEIPTYAFIFFLCLWGLSVVADSPQLSALVAINAADEIKGSVITLTTCLGFAITIVSIQLLAYLQNHISGHLLLILLAPGPIIGTIFLKRLG